jgi:4-hydroxythreonine-4-phosphate dehydrogenase
MRPLALTMGDPAGIGLELAARVWSERGRRPVPPFFIIGDLGALSRAFARSDQPCPQMRLARSAAEITVNDTALAVLPTPLAEEEEPGTANPANSRAVAAAVEAGVAAVRAGAASGLVTLPINKAAMNAGGFNFAGHTEFIGKLTASDPWPFSRGPVMMLTSPSLRVAFATSHTPLRDVPALLTVERVMLVSRIVGEAMKRDFGIANPRIALCGLNPHGGEGGYLGREEVDVINPAAALLRAEGWNVSDARSADSLFHEKARSTYDVAVTMYHDQGLIPIKTLHFWDSANVTLGLPVVRTSPDHGTGFDIAGKGVARSDSLIVALELAYEMATKRAAAQEAPAARVRA